MEIAQQKIFRAVVRPRLFADYLRDIAVQRLTTVSLSQKTFWYSDPPETDAEKDYIYQIASQRLLLNEDELESNLQTAAMKGQFRYVWPDLQDGVLYGSKKVRPVLGYESQVLMKLIGEKFTGVKLIPVMRITETRFYAVDVIIIW